MRKDDRIVGFTNLWKGGDKEELAFDVMRFHPDAPDAIMDYLIVELMAWAQAQGYRWFNLGIAPLQMMLESHPLAPLWHRVGRLVYRQSEYFPDIVNHRRYAEGLNSIWQPKYLACPGGLDIPRIVQDIAKLIAAPQKT